MSRQNKTPLVIQIDTPIVSIKELSDRSGISVSTIRRLILNGFIQTDKEEGQKTTVRINMVDLYFRAAMSSMTLQEFLKKNIKGDK